MDMRRLPSSWMSVTLDVAVGGGEAEDRFGYCRCRVGRGAGCGGRRLGVGWAVSGWGAEGGYELGGVFVGMVDL